MMKKQLFVMCLLACYVTTINARQKSAAQHPNVGDTISDHTFTDLVNYPHKSATYSDFRGKWLILDFWGPSCSSCIASFPKMNKLFEQFKENVQLFMVADISNDSRNGKRTLEQKSKDMYSRLDQRYHLKLPVAFDSILVSKYDVGAIPHIMIIDPQGILRAKVVRIDSAKIVELIAGGNPDFKKDRAFSKSERRQGDSYNRDLPLLTNGDASNGGVDTGYLFRSILCGWTDAMPYFKRVDLNDDQSIEKILSSGKLEVFGSRIERLLRLAYIGTTGWSDNDTGYTNNYYSNLIIESDGGDSIVSKISPSNLYSYSLKIPPAMCRKELLMKCLQDDMERFFGYTAKVEVRKVPVYFVNVGNRAKLDKLVTSRSEEVEAKTEDITYGRRAYYNYPFDLFVRNTLGVLYLDLPVMDDTGFRKRVDVELKANLVDPVDVIRKMENLGLKIEQGTKEMKVVVIRKNGLLN